MKKFVSIIISVIAAAFILSFGIAAPILIRPFYYAQIDSLELVQSTGCNRQQIIDAYDEMLDYCTGISDDFGTGVLKWSESGKSHFDDVRSLFLLDLRVLMITAVILIIFTVICAKTGYSPYNFFGHTPYFYSGVCLISLITVTGLIVISDFENAFKVFHMLFFPGKDNWIFDERTDQIILILPEQFFYNCALMILAVIIFMCAAFIVTSMIKKKCAKIRLRRD